MRRTNSVIAVVVLAAACCVGFTSTPPRATRRPARPAHATRTSPRTPGPAVLQPLRELAGSLDRVARRRFPNAYGGVALDAGRDAVALYATTTAAGRRIVRAARRSAPELAWQRVRVLRSRFSRRLLDSAAARVVAHARHSDLDSVSVPVDGSGLVADVSGTPPRGLAHAGGVPIAVRHAPVRRPKSWADVKWHDWPAFIGGDVLTWNGANYCTAGLPAVTASTGRPVMITAAHCFGVGRRVYTAGGKTGAYGNGMLGNYVGTVTARKQMWDAETLVGADNNADVSATNWWKPMTSAAYSYVGDYVCQAGQASYYLGHPTPCGIKVTDDDLWFRIAGYWARGVEGVDVVHGWGSHNGDSGGTVFAVQPGGRYQARGIVSSGGADGTPDQKRVDWTEAVDIFRAYGLRLNPHT